MFRRHQLNQISAQHQDACCTASRVHVNGPQLTMTEFSSSARINAAYLITDTMIATWKMCFSRVSQPNAKGTAVTDGISDLA